MFTEIRFNHFSLKFLRVLGVSVVQFLFLCFAVQACIFKQVLNNSDKRPCHRYKSRKNMTFIVPVDHPIRLVLSSEGFHAVKCAVDLRISQKVE